MQPLVIAASPLTYTQYRKLSFADFRVRHPLLYVGLPIIQLITLLSLGAIVVDTGVEAVDWQDARYTLLMSGVTVFVWSATWYSLRRTYSRSSDLREGVVYRLDEKGLTQAPGTQDQEVIPWSNIAKAATTSSSWVLLRQTSPVSKETYFLNAASVMSPANRSDLYALLEYKRIKRV